MSEQKYVLCLPVGNTPAGAELTLQEGVFFNQENEPLLMTGILRWCSNDSFGYLHE